MFDLEQHVKQLYTDVQVAARAQVEWENQRARASNPNEMPTKFEDSKFWDFQMSGAAVLVNYAGVWSAIEKHGDQYAVWLDTDLDGTLECTTPDMLVDNPFDVFADIRESYEL